jgi:hypothetical protein
MSEADYSSSTVPCYHSSWTNMSVGNLRAFLSNGASATDEVCHRHQRRYCQQWLLFAADVSLPLQAWRKWTTSAIRVRGWRSRGFLTIYIYTCIYICIYIYIYATAYDVCILRNSIHADQAPAGSSLTHGCRVLCVSINEPEDATIK